MNSREVEVRMIVEPSKSDAYLRSGRHCEARHVFSVCRTIHGAVWVSGVLTLPIPEIKRDIPLCRNGLLPFQNELKMFGLYEKRYLLAFPLLTQWHTCIGMLETSSPNSAGSNRCSEEGVLALGCHLNMDNDGIQPLQATQLSVGD